MKILLITDAWRPQVNGVVTTWENTIEMLEKEGHDVKVIEPSYFKKVPLPTYPEIKISYKPFPIKHYFEEFMPDVVHIATEGPIGLAGRRICHKKNIPYTTSYHTKFPEYIRERVPIPLSLSYKVIKFLHRKSHNILVSSSNVKKELSSRGISNITVWPKGFNEEIFSPDMRTELGYERPIFTYVGRVAPEKNLEDFLKLDLPGTKVVVGNGPSLEELKKKFPDTHFLGKKTGKDLAKFYASSDVMVFPSLTDVYGLVIIESIACGTPVAAYNVTGPKDLITNNVDGYVSEDLKTSALKALNINRDSVVESSKKWSRKKSCEIFLENVKILKNENRN